MSVSKSCFILFQSTLPTRGATELCCVCCHWNHCFNPRSPRGERQSTLPSTRVIFMFQSTLPTRGATNNACNDSLSAASFNPRSPRGERLWIRSHPCSRRCFNPRSPRGERLRFASFCACLALFQSTLPTRGATDEAGRR